jgi:hypothetical protein
MPFMMVLKMMRAIHEGFGNGSETPRNGKETSARDNENGIKTIPIVIMSTV